MGSVLWGRPASLRIRCLRGSGSDLISPRPATEAMSAWACGFGWQGGETLSISTPGTVDATREAPSTRAPAIAAKSTNGVARRLDSMRIIRTSSIRTLGDGAARPDCRDAQVFSLQRDEKDTGARRRFAGDQHPTPRVEVENLPRVPQLEGANAIAALVVDETQQTAGCADGPFDRRRVEHGGLAVAAHVHPGPGDRGRNDELVLPGREHAVVPLRGDGKREASHQPSPGRGGRGGDADDQLREHTHGCPPLPRGAPR